MSKEEILKRLKELKPTGQGDEFIISTTLLSVIISLLEYEPEESKSY